MSHIRLDRAAALTVGRLTAAVQEIHEVGAELHWADDMDILKHFGAGQGC